MDVGRRVPRGGGGFGSIFEALERAWLTCVWVTAEALAGLRT